MADKRNIKDRYKGWVDELIREDLEANYFPFAVLMEHLIGDFNIGTIVRTANAMGAERVYYCGKRKWDRRGAVGTHNYTTVEHLIDLDHVAAAANNHNYTMVGLEATEGARSLYGFEWPKKPLIIVGEEGRGLSDEMLDKCEYIVEIPQYGSVRSLNAATAAGIAMYDFVHKYQRVTIEGVNDRLNETTAP